LINRFNQGYYEYIGNYVTGFYNAVICVLSPTLLKNDWDIYTRTFLTLTVFSLSLYTYFKSYVPKNKLIVSIFIIIQFPIFYHYRVGLGTYLPETPAGIIIISGYLIFLKFLENESRRLFLVSVVLLLIPTLIRFNFIVYTFILIIPISILFILKFKNLKHKKTYILSITFILTSIIYHFIFCYDKFILYYTKIAYFYGNIIESSHYLKQDLNNILGVESFVELIIISILIGLYKIKQLSIYNLLLLMYPFIFYFYFIVIYLKSTNVPHIISVLIIFLILFLFPFCLIFTKKTQNENSSKNKYLTIFLWLIIVFQNINYIDKYMKIKTLNENKITSKVADILIEASKEKKIKYMTFYDAMQETRINTEVFKKTNKFSQNKIQFYTHDIFFKNLINCKNSYDCFNIYKNDIIKEKYDFIFINKHDNKIFHKNSLLINRKVRKFLKLNSEYSLITTIKDDYIGETYCYKLKN
jgi:hypothetical protein